MTKEPRYTQAPAGRIPGSSVPPMRPPAHDYLESNPIPQPEPEVPARMPFVSRLGHVVLGAVIGFTGFAGWAFWEVSRTEKPVPVPAGVVEREKARGPDAENIGAGIQRVDDWERGISCYLRERYDSTALSCTPMPSEQPARAAALEKLVL